MTPIEANAVAATPVAAFKEILSFRIGAEEYGIDILKVQEIRGYDTPTRIVNTPDFIKGVVNLRGVIVPIVDLRMKLGLGEPTYGPLTVVIVLNVSSRVVGAVVDSVSDVAQLDPAQVKPVPEFSAALDGRFLTGIATVRQGDADRMLILLDIEQLLASADMGLAG